VTEFLVEHGIDSISLNPDSVISATRRILEIEKRLQRKIDESSVV
jgi:phosphoenolpyruvate synthase/pyruvate phosphate dikinase